MTDQTVDAKVNEKVEQKKLEFPTPTGDGCTAFDKNSGWLWVGIRIPSLDYQGALSFLHSSHFLIWSLYKELENKKKADLITPTPNFVGALLKR